VSLSAKEQAERFLAESGQFRLGELTTEASHQVTRNLSEAASRSISEALRLLFDVDRDVIETYRRWIGTEAPKQIADNVSQALKQGHHVFFTGCGATGRLSILLETYFRRVLPAALQDRVHSVMAGGDYALIKSVEGFEDFAQFGAKQIEDMGVSAGDVVFAITEGGETSFVIGMAWKALEKGATVYFVYNNPDETLRKRVERSRNVLDEPRITKVNLTTGPMAIMGSTRMQATTIQLCAVFTILQMALQRLTSQPIRNIASEFLADLEETHGTLKSDEVRDQLATIVEAEARTYASGHKSTYFADALGIDVLTDTTERSPTFCTPAFRKWDDPDACESWTHLILPYPDSKSTWTGLLGRPPYGLTWTDAEIRALVGDEKATRQSEIMKNIGPDEILRFRMGLDGLQSRPICVGDIAVAVMSGREDDSYEATGSFFRDQLQSAMGKGATGALIYLGQEENWIKTRETLGDLDTHLITAFIPVKSTAWANEIAHVAAKMALNALSTCIMVCLGRVIGNCMVCVVPSNLKLIDRSVRYVQTLTGLSYEDACHRLFESIEYVRSRMESGQAYPPPVALTVKRIECGLTLADAEAALEQET
jgi:N-acetylmuramic acid 6-phosphate etherase